MRHEPQHMRPCEQHGAHATHGLAAPATSTFSSSSAKRLPTQPREPAEKAKKAYGSGLVAALLSPRARRWRVVPEALEADGRGFPSKPKPSMKRSGMKSQPLAKVSMW